MIYVLYVILKTGIFTVSNYGKSGHPDVGSLESQKSRRLAGMQSCIIGHLEYDVIY